jgi:predicted permease
LITVLFACRRAWRSVVHAPLVSGGIVLCVGLGVGSTTAVFGWMEHLVWRPLPAVHSVDRVVSVVTRGPEQEGRVSYPDYQDWRDASTSFRGLAAFGIRQFGVRASQDPAATESAWGLLVSDNYFDVLEVRAIAGRTFLPGESHVEGQTAHVVISSQVARKRFGSGTAAIGRSIRINEVPFTVIGVAPSNFSGTIAGLAFDVWVPVTMHPSLTGEARALTARGMRWLQTFGRLRDGVGVGEAGAEIEAISGHLARAHAENEGRGAFVTRLDTGIARRLETLFTILVGIGGLVALIVCTNVANLLMLRGAVRRYEIGVCLALGASRRQIVSQFLIEAALLAAGGAAVGLLLARWVQGLLPALMPASPLPLALDAPADWRTFAFALALSASMMIVFGVGPAIQALRGAVLPNLRLARGGTTRNAARLRAALVAAQLAFSLAALASAGVFLRASSELSALDRGLDRPEAVLVVATDLEQAGHRSAGARLQAVQRLLSKIRALADVRSAAAATFVPLGFGGYSSLPARVPGYTPEQNENMMILTNRVSSDYFRTLGIAIRDGRPIDERDTDGSPAVVVVNEAFVQRFMPGRAVIGSRIELGGRALTVVGMAANGKYRFDALDEPSPPHVYLPYAQQTRPAVTLHVRANGPPEALMPQLRQAFADVDPALPLNSPTTLDEYTSLPLLPVRLGTVVLSSLGAMALILASAGLYSVVAYRMTQRWRELAVRIALGASASRLVRFVMGEGLRQVAAGLGFGLLLGLVAIRIVGSRVPRAAAADPVVLMAAAGLLIAVSIVAALVPAAKAWRIDPASVLRGE